jgi:hypothetical protein
MDLKGAYPWLSYAVFTILCVSTISYSYHVYSTARNPRLLSGKELEMGSATFNAIRSADAVAEDFGTSGTRQRLSNEAAIQLAQFQSYAHSKEATHAVLIFAYYFDQVKKLSTADIELAHERWKANQHTYDVMTGRLNYDDQDMIGSAVPYTQALAERFRVERILTACRNESLSYIFPDHQPPIDNCIFFHDQPTVER